MKKILVFIFLLFFLAGCATPKKAELTIKDKNFLNRWMETADVSYRIGDYRLSCEYYQRVLDRYPDSESAQVAKRKIELLQKALRRSGTTDF